MEYATESDGYSIIRFDAKMTSGIKALGTALTTLLKYLLSDALFHDAKTEEYRTSAEEVGIKMKFRL